jgi:hypothetical protein
MKIKFIFIISLLILTLSASAYAVPTHITVRVKTKDAKFLGTNMGGALVIIKNVITGELLARGITEGSTGDTKHIMKDPRERGIPLSDDNSAKYTAVIDIDEPTYIEVVAEGPISEPLAKNSAGITQWVIPGKHISEGDALLLEISGLLVKILAPPKESVFSELSRNVEIYTMVRMLSGSTLTPDGIWDSNKFEIKAVVKKDGKEVEEVTLEYAGRPSLFSGTFTSEEAGTYDLIVYAYDPASGNTGIDSVAFEVR